MIVGFTGTRKGMTDRQKKTLTVILEHLYTEDFHYGDCLGADEQAYSIAYDIGFVMISHPCNIENMRAHTLADEEWEIKEPLHRNQDIVNICNLLIAAPASLQEEQRSGTWATIRYARQRERPVIILDP
jgi:hypothetical protein